MSIRCKKWNLGCWCLFTVAMGALLLSCARPPEKDPLRRPLTGREILTLVARNDNEPLPEVAGVEVFDVGQYEDMPGGRVPGEGPGMDELCPSFRYRFISHSRQVQAAPMHAFGFSFRLQGAPHSAEMGNGRAVPLTLSVAHPPLVDPVSGDVVRVERQHIMGCVGEPGQALFQFDSDWAQVSGEWILTLQLGDRVLASKSFEVVGGHAPDVLTAAVAESVHEEDAVAPPLRTKIDMDMLAQAIGEAEQQEIILAETDAMGKVFEPKQTPLQTVAQPGNDAGTVYAAQLRPGATPAKTPATVAVTSQAPSSITEQTQETRTPAALPQKGIYVLASSNVYMENAQRHAGSLRDQGYPATVGRYVDADGRVWHTVRIGRFPTTAVAASAARDFKSRTGHNAFVVVRREETLAAATPAATPAATIQPRQTVSPAGNKATASAPVASAAPPAAPMIIAPADVGQGAWAVQVGAYLEAENAYSDLAMLQQHGWSAATVHDRQAKGRVWHTVLLGRHGSEAAAQGQAQQFKRQEGRQAFVVAAP